MLRRRKLVPLADRGPLRVFFVTTALNVGGEEVLLANLIRRMDRNRFQPELCCLKQLGSLGEQLAHEVPSFSGLLSNKLDARVWGRLTQLMRERRTDAVVTVGTGGDKMFWGRLAARRAGVPVIVSALHSTGFPNRVEFSNRLLAPITDAFIAVGEHHGRFLTSGEGCPAHKVCVIRNGIDTDRFRDRAPDAALQAQLGLAPGAPVVGIVAVLRTEKNHDLFVRAAARVHAELPEARFLIVGDGPLRKPVEERIAALQLDGVVKLLGLRPDVPELLSLMNVVALTSDIESNPVSILEALASQRPVVATRVGSIPENVIDGQTGYLVPPGDEEALAVRLIALLRAPADADRMGIAGRQHVLKHASLGSMVDGYQELIRSIYEAKQRGHRWSNALFANSTGNRAGQDVPLIESETTGESVAAHTRP